MLDRRRARLRLPDRRRRRHARLFRPRRVAHDRARPQDAGGCARDPAPRAAGVRARRARDDRARRAALLTFVVDRRRPDRRRDGRRARRDLAPVARARLPPHRSRVPRASCWSRPGPRCCPRFPSRCARRRGAISSGSASRCGPGSRSPASRPDASQIGSETHRRRDGAVGGRRGGLAARRARSACRSTAPGACSIQPDLTIPGHPDVFVIGDLASLNGADGKPLPGVAQVAIQMGRHAAANIPRAIEQQPYAPFHYRDLGNMATIGRASAVADFGWLQLKGYLGWLAWAFVHILNLIGFRNRARRLRAVGVGLLQLPALGPPDHGRCTGDRARGACRLAFDSRSRRRAHGRRGRSSSRAGRADRAAAVRARSNAGTRAGSIRRSSAR